MGRKHTGLRNRHRSGRSTYSIMSKGNSADRYGMWSQGRQERPDMVAGHVLRYRDTYENRQLP